MTWHEQKSPIQTNKGIENKSPIHHEVSLKNSLSNTLRSPLQSKSPIDKIPIESVRAIGLKENEIQQSINDLKKYMEELPEIDIKNIGMVVFDWGSEKRGEALQDTLPESYWDEKGREQSMKDYKKYIKKGNKSALLFNPIWGDGDRLERSTVYHEVGHTLFHKFRPGDTPEVMFWNQQANKYGWDAMTDVIIKRYPTHKGGLGRGSLVREYVADHYSAYHLGIPIPIEEKQWFDERYNHKL